MIECENLTKTYYMGDSEYKALRGINLHIDNNELEYTITQNPLNGDFSLNGSFLTYIPSLNYFGLDSIKF